MSKEIKEGELVVGRRYVIDKDFANSGEVVLVRIYGNHFCRVADPDDGVEWDTMKYRLSEINAKDLKQ